MKLNSLLIFTLVLASLLFPFFLKATVWQVTNTANAGAGSLRAACDSVVSGDSVRFNPNLIANGSQIITLDSAIILNKSISITGLFNSQDSLFISGGNNSRAFGFNIAGKVVLDSLVFRNGTGTNVTSPPSLGGGISLLYIDTVFISNCLFRDNNSGNGGAIYYKNDSLNAYLEMNHCVLNNNYSGLGGGFFALGEFSNLKFNHVDFYSNYAGAYGSAIRVDATDSMIVFLNNSTFKNHNINGNTNQTPFRGGAVSLESNKSKLKVNRCEFENNDAKRGGAIYTSDGILEISNSTFVNNTCLYTGGAICNISSISPELTLVNSTFYLNEVTGTGSQDVGGAIYLITYGTHPASFFDIKNCTFYKNEANFHGGIASSIGSRIEGSIFSDNVGGNIPSMTSLGYNIFSDSARTDTVSTDQINIDSAAINLLALANNGRGTRTLMPGPGSVALEAGNPLDTSDAQNAYVMGIREIGAAEVCYNTSDTDFVVACDRYTWLNGTTYSASDTGAVFIIPNTAGCDSVVTLNLTILHSSDSMVTHTVCDSLVWLDGNTYFFSNNSATHIIPNAIGCDSVIYLDLTVTNSILDVQVACDSLTWRNGITYYSDTTMVTDTVTSALGCNTVYYLDLTILTSSLATDSIYACGSYTWNGITYTQSNYTALDTLTNYLGCDSLVKLALNITPNIHTYDTVNACFFYSWIDGKNYIASTQSPTYILPASNGCDSIIHLDLTIGYPVTGVDTQQVCDSLVWIDGNTYYSSTQSAVHTISGGSSIGCDSIVTLNLTVLNSAPTIEYVTACQSYTWNGITYTSSTNAPTDTLTNRHGCDSIIQLDLIILGTLYGTETVVACDSYLWNGMVYTSSTNTPHDTLQSALGCDSIVSLDLTILDITYGTETVMVCDSFTWNGVLYIQSNTTATDTLVNAMGCDSIVTLDLTILNSFPSTEVITACHSYTWVDGTTYYASTQSPVFVYQNLAGCDSLVQLDLTIDTVDTQVTQIASALNALATNASYQWIDCESGLPITGETNANYLATVNGNYAVEITQNGCVDTSDCIAVTNVGVDKLSLSKNLRIYPNPVNDQVNIEITSWPVNKAKIVVRDVSGKQVYTQEIEPISNQETIHVNTSQWAKGNYFIEVGEGVNKVVEQIVVQ